MRRATLLRLQEDVLSNLDRDVTFWASSWLHLAGLPLHGDCLPERRTLCVKSPQDELAAAEKLINDCGYHRRDEELAAAKQAILGS